MKAFLSTTAMMLFAAPALAQTSLPESAGGLAKVAFGGTVVIGEHEVIVAEPNNPHKSGMLYVFGRGADGTWIESAQLVPSDPERDNRFGRALAIEGGRLLVGATRTDSSRGAAYIFERTDDGWRQTARLIADDRLAGDALGRAVALRGDLALVSAAGANELAGAVYVFQLRGDTWTQVGKLEASDATAGRLFGISVSVRGDWMATGAPARDSLNGVVYVFQRDAASGTWEEVTKLAAPGDDRGNQYGSTLLLSDGELLVGAPNAANRTGAVYRYELDDGDWSFAGRLLPFDGQQRYEFGSALALDGNAIWVGAPSASNFTGQIYVFGRDDAGQLTMSHPLRGEDPSRRDGFGGALAVRGDLAVVGVPGDDFGEGTTAIYERTDGHWRRVSTVWSEVTGFDAITEGQVDCDDGSAAAWNCSEVDIVSFLPVSDIGGGRGVRMNDVWGWTDPENGREYAIVGRVDGTAFVDVTDAGNPVYVGNLAMTDGARMSVWRDMKVYKDHVFIVSDGAGPHGMQVFDLRQLRDVRGAPVEFEETVHYDGIASAHNIVINEETGFAYSVGSSGGGETCGGGYHMIDIRDPQNPTFAGCFAHEGTGRRGTGYTHDGQCVVYHGPDSQYSGREICFGSNETALSIADVTDKDSPVGISTADYPNVAYSHQGWLTEDQRYFYMNDEGDEPRGLVDHTRTLVWDVADLDDPILVKEHFGVGESTDHNLYIRGRYMYQSNYVDGLRVLDIGDPVNPVEVAFFDTVPFEGAGGGSWSNYPFFESGVIVVTSSREGLFILKKRQRTLVP